MKRTALLVSLGVVLGTLIPVATVSAWNSDSNDKHPKCSDTQYLNEDHKCVPKRCPYDVSLTITDKKCVKPPSCPTNPQLLQSDDKCIATSSPTPEPTPVPPPVPMPSPVTPHDTRTPTTSTQTQIQIDLAPATPFVEANGEVFTGK